MLKVFSIFNHLQHCLNSELLMLVTIALAFIGVLLVLANYKYIRKIKFRIIALVFSATPAVIGSYYIMNPHKGMQISALTPLFTPITAFILFLITRAIFNFYKKQELILYIKGFYPVKNEERFVSPLEVTLTALITFLAVIIPFICLGGIHQILENINY